LTKVLNQPPAKDEIEVTVFGPGIGESILVHCGNGEWICVDCTVADEKCLPLWYLEQLRLQASTCVRLIVATHWHADHVKGLARLLGTCSRAQFVCSSALRADEFKMIVARFSTKEPGAARPPLSEVRKCFELLAQKKATGVADYRPPIFASAHITLDRFTVGPNAIEVIALSPSPQDDLNAKEAFASYFVPVDESATGLSPIDQNHASIVLSIQIDGEFLLLGADLEKTNSQLTGWNAVVASRIRPQQLSTLFKVPHHGSVNAQSDDVWRRMLSSSAAAVVTPYTVSGLPREEVISWLLERCRSAYATGLPKNSRLRRRPEVERTIREATLNFASRRLPAEPGIVRFRKLLGAAGAWSVEMFGEAQELVA
jgi:beta-lactamase superfamily II metal-dependent hydrolase